MTRAPVDTIVAPLFPTRGEWVNARAPQSPLRRGRPMLVEFWDFCRPNSMRTLPYVKAWHERYADAGLRVIGVHCPGFEPSRPPDAVRDAVARLGIRHPVLIDSELEVWRDYDNAGWPARYLFDGGARLVHYQYGEGAYEETELAIGELLGLDVQPLAPLRAEDAAGARLVAHSEEFAGAYCGPYEAGAVWAVLDGSGAVDVALDARAERLRIDVTHPGAYALIEHERHTAGAIEVTPGAGVRCHATCFLPGLA
ncbi:MAG TPA: DipZ protein [Solirubrobacteraceae bacterium]|nr:DipZ protein [Solirubrobacteraceae bacterium]